MERKRHYNCSKFYRAKVSISILGYYLLLLCSSKLEYVLHKKIQGAWIFSKTFKVWRAKRSKHQKSRGEKPPAIFIFFKTYSSVVSKPCEWMVRCVMWGTLCSFFWKYGLHTLMFEIMNSFHPYKTWVLTNNIRYGPWPS